MSEGTAKDQRLFWGCFVALIATAFGFIVRALIIGDWQAEFGLDETEKGKIIGVGLWPFAISIVIFSLFIDRIGYGKAMMFAFVCHILSAILTIFATNYTMLYFGTFICALGNGTVEAFINPVVATMFSKQKAKWLNILHAGWPAGLVLGGLIALAMGPEVSWKVKVGLLFIPTAIYGLMLFGQKFPKNERVAAGVSDKDMLGEMGAMGAFIVSALIVFQLGAVFGFASWLSWTLVAACTIGYGLWVQALGRPLFALLLLCMIPLATTELGTDGWVTDLMTPEMGANAGYVLVYTSFIMMVLRFCAGPIVHRISPLGLLACSSAVACLGLIFLSRATGFSILLAATIFAFGKTFFWPTMLAVVSERFPRGGALTLNVTGGVGMLGVGIVGSVFLGHIQDQSVDRTLEEDHRAVHAAFISADEKTSIFGKYKSLDQEKVKAAQEKKTAYDEAQAVLDDADASVADQAAAQIALDSNEAAANQVETIDEATGAAKKSALSTVAIFPAAMLGFYLLLILWFRTKGGYKAVDLEEGSES